jgi:hypothetical protein
MKSNEWESFCHQIILPEIKPPSPLCPPVQRVVNNFDREEGTTRSAQGHEFMQDNFSIGGVENGSMILS